MNNRVDYYNAIQSSLAIPAGRPVVFIDGVICEFLEVAEIVRAANPAFGSARFIYNPSACDNSTIVPAEQVETVAPMGKSISVRQLYDGGIGRALPEGVSIFEGQIERIETNIDDNGEVVQIVAKDLAAVLDRITIYGKRVLTTDGQTLFLDGAKTIFNENNEPDAAKETFHQAGQSYTVFEKKTDNAVHWSYGKIIHYLLCEYSQVGKLMIPSVGQLEMVTNNYTAGEINVNGLSLISAVEKCCEDVGIRFKFVWRNEANGPAVGITFYRQGRGAEVELNCQPAGQSLTISTTNIYKLNSSRDLWPVTHRYIGWGDYREFETTFDLIKAWDSSLQGGPRADYSTTSGNFEPLRDVYRKWCLNEAGDYTDAPYSQGDAFDFTRIFGSDKYLRRARVFAKALSCDDYGDSFGFYLEVSYDSGDNWAQYADDFDVLNDECGVWLSDVDFSDAVWNAAVAGTLRFRITATVQSDERLSYTIALGPVDSTVEVIDHLIDKSSVFEYRKVSPRSIFANYPADEADDTEPLVGFIRRHTESECDSNSNVFETVDVMTPMIAMDYRVGDRVTSSPDSRDILGARADNRSLFWIEKITMDFQKQCTKLKVLRRRAYD